MSQEVIREPKGRWAKGSSGNPSGARRRPRLAAELLADALDRADKSGDRTNAEAIVDRLVELATTAEGPVAIAAIKLIWDRSEGRAPHRVEVAHEHGIDEELAAILAALGIPGAAVPTAVSCPGSDADQVIDLADVDAEALTVVWSAELPDDGALGLDPAGDRTVAS